MAEKNLFDYKFQGPRRSLSFFSVGKWKGIPSWEHSRCLENVSWSNYLISVGISAASRQGPVIDCSWRHGEADGAGLSAHTWPASSRHLPGWGWWRRQMGAERYQCRAWSGKSMGARS